MKNRIKLLGNLNRVIRKANVPFAAIAFVMVTALSFISCTEPEGEWESEPSITDDSGNKLNLAEILALSRFRFPAEPI